MSEKWALVTGACVNTGAAIVEKFASQGENVVFTGRNAEKVKSAEEIYRKKYSEVKIVGKVLNALDDSGRVDEIGVERVFNELDGEGVTVTDLVLNAADLGVGFNALDSSLDDFIRVINTNLCWNFCIIQHAAKRMKNCGGSITFIIPTPHTGLYRSVRRIQPQKAGNSV